MFSPWFAYNLYEKMELISILFFFVLIFLIGISVKLLLRLNLEEKIITNLFLIIGLGLGVFVLLINIFNLVNIPLDFKIFLLIGVIVPLYWLIKNRKKIKLKTPKLTKELIYSIALLVILGSYLIFFMNGANKYSYLEDDDPWGYAEAAKYVTIEKKYDAKPSFTHYLEPYPPAYASLMGIIHQNNSSIFETLKLFNVLLMTLTLAFFYILTNLLFNRNAAIISTIILALTPAFMSHFIWSQTLAIALFMVSFYFIIKFTKEKEENYFYASIILFASCLNVQTIASVKIGVIFALLFVCISIFYWKEKERKTIIQRLFLIGLLGLILSCVIYWIPALIHQGPEKFLTIAEGFSVFQSASTSAVSMAQYANPIYSIKDIIIAPMSSKIDQATGIGLFTFITLLIGLFFMSLRFKKLKEPITLFIILWFIWELISLKSGSLPIGLFAQRTWAYISIPIALIGGYGVYQTLKSTKKIHFTIPVIILLVLIAGFYQTSYLPKKAVQQAMWPPGASWTSNEELQGYVSLKELPPNTKVYSGCQSQAMVIGMDKLSFPWIEEVREYKEKIITEDLETNYIFLKKYEYDYLIISSKCAKDYGVNETNEKIQKLQEDNRFKVANANNGFILYRVI